MVKEQHLHRLAPPISLPAATRALCLAQKLQCQKPRAFAHHLPYTLSILDELAQRLPRNDQMRFTCHARASLATTNLIGISRVIRSRLNICRGTDGRVLPRPGDAIPPAGCFTRRSLPPIYIRDTTAPLTADRPATEDDPENGPPTERDHSTRPATEREQEDQGIIETESDLPIQESSRDTGWTPG